MGKKFDFVAMDVDWGEFTADYVSVYCYVDTTLDDNTPVYVGLGSGPRIRHKRARNQKHLNIALKHRIKRTVVASYSKDAKQLACDNEKRLIAELGTFSTRTNKGCNFTLGGDGTAGHIISEEEKERRRARQTGDGNVAKRPDVRRKISESQRGKKFSKERRQNISEAKKGKAMPDETRQKISKSMSATMSRNHAQRNAHLVPLHQEIIRLRNSGLSIIDVMTQVSAMFKREVKYSSVTNTVHVHKKGQCQTCNNNPIEVDRSRAQQTTQASDQLTDLNA